MLRFRYFTLIIQVFLAVLFCGCASDRSGDLSSLMSELEVEDVSGSEKTGPNAPEEPLPSLPPPPDVKAVTGGADAEGSITIQPDCLLKIRVEEDSSLDGNYHVNNIGAIEFGYIGPIILYNKTEKSAEAKIEKVLEGRDFRNATVDVDIIRASYDKVRVRGAVNNPGVVKIGAGDSISLNDLLLRAGGMKATARGAKVKVVRKGMTTAVAPSLEGREYTMVTEEGHPEVPDVELHNNDDVYVFSSRAEPSVDVGEKRITVLGQVKRQGIYRFSGGEPCTMMHLVFKMGGLPRYADATEIKLIREEEDGFETEMEVNVKEILKEGDPDKDIPLENGDRVVVPARRIHLF